MVNQLKYQNILFCTDYSKDAEVAFVHAFDQASKYEAKLHIMNVILSVNPCGIKIFNKTLSKAESKIESDKIDERHSMQELGALKKVYNERCKDIIDHEFIVKVGSPDIEIITYSEDNDIDMIILGTAGRPETKRRTYVRTAANVSKYANCQVITIGSPKQ
ncbi:MAG: universal stress protein [Desulfobacula sp.]|jgi:nucleotide-binding universal stress UspA family protein|uniref:universal stress protein n=1 Tax=Desulfobacula sp. TaxID=2593537 RepID=UPI001DCA24BF|nr:universal stress protein [Desulfobacula sp.]MBT3485519.1 universal stress protein [Desulfobacula sp.]MBT3805336.1 universal stress protein [Desulfobacula sp.]MBT4025688.1 universal stress protein [Desulfobacula sp.]MBT4197499.1 universal stress protein [Desulfobacula sp.]